MSWIGVISLLGLSLTLLIFIFSLRSKPSSFDSDISHEKLSILIPFKNESGLDDQLEYLLKLVSGTEIKVFWVDDFSDSIPRCFLEAVEDIPNFNLIRRNAGKPGKKQAISCGMKYIATEWVLLMDADTQPDSGFFSGGSLPAKKDWKMILLPVAPVFLKGIVRSFFDLEFLTLQMVTHAAARLGCPLLANGAALLVKRDSYLETQPYRSDFHIPSGDDIFALFAFRRRFGSKSIGSLAGTIEPFKAEFPKSPVKLWNQRLRWVSKTGQVKNFWYQFISFLVLAGNISFIYFAIAFFNKANTGLATTSMLVYLASAIAFLFTAMNFNNRRQLSLLLIPAIFVYPFYLSALITASAIRKPKWK